MNEVAIVERLKQKGLRPHQVDFVQDVLKAGSGARFLIADDIGLGKSVSCAALLGEIARQNGAGMRAIVIAPSSLTDQWLQELEVWGGLAAFWYATTRFPSFEPLCPTCQYNLTGNVSGICPECGTEVAQPRSEEPFASS